MKNKTVLLTIIVLLFMTSGITMALPPNILDFSFAKYIRRMEKLFHDKVVHVCIVKKDGMIFPSAIVFESKIVFLDDNGNQTSEQVFGPLMETRVTESVDGNYIYVFGAFKDRPGGINRIYSHDGKVLLEKDSSDRIGIKGLGIPVEGKKFLVLAKDGELSLTNFKGDVIANKKILDKEKGEDGDIEVAATQDGNKIFAGANRLILPPADNKQLPILYSFDSNLNILSQDSSSFLMILDLQCTPNGKFLVIKAEADGNRSPLVITDSGYRPLLSLENAHSVKFSADNNYLIYEPRVGPPNIISCSNWQVFYQPAISNDYPWLDTDISDDGSKAFLFNGVEILIIDSQKKEWHSASFPYSFMNCRISGNSHRLILMGEFGFVVYDIVTK